MKNYIHGYWVLDEAIETSLFEWYKYMGGSPIVKLYEDSHVTWVSTGVLHPFMNGVFCTQLPRDTDTIDKMIENVTTHFRSRPVPFMWWTTQSVELEVRLETHGLIYPGETPGMAVDLQVLHEDVSPPAHFTVEIVHDHETVKQWVQTLMCGFHIPEKSEQVCIDLFASLGFDLPLRNYVGMLHGKTVAISSLFLGGGVAGIYCVTTLPEVRRQGIGSLMTLIPLRDAYDLGYRIGVLQSSDLGFGVYRNLGFQKYCSLRSRVWEEENAQDCFNI